MPKEYTHWVLAEKVLQNAPERIKRMLSRNRQLYYLGAVAPDTPYYYLFGKDRARFKNAADFLHGRNEKNLSLIHISEPTRRRGIPVSYTHLTLPTN